MPCHATPRHTNHSQVGSRAQVKVRLITDRNDASPASEISSPAVEISSPAAEMRSELLQLLQLLQLWRRGGRRLLAEAAATCDAK